VGGLSIRTPRSPFRKRFSDTNPASVGGLGIRNGISGFVNCSLLQSVMRITSPLASSKRLVQPTIGGNGSLINFPSSMLPFIGANNFNSRMETCFRLLQSILPEASVRYVSFVTFFDVCLHVDLCSLSFVASTCGIGLSFPSHGVAAGLLDRPTQCIQPLR
jgi:hypothetical protein